MWDGGAGHSRECVAASASPGHDSGAPPHGPQAGDLAPCTAARPGHQEVAGHGRIPGPAQRLEFAGHNREVSIIGVQNIIEILDRAASADYQSRLEEEADATADELATS